MIALVAVALVALATPQLAEAGCMSTPAVEEFFRVVVRKTFILLSKTPIGFLSRISSNDTVLYGWEISPRNYYSPAVSEAGDGENAFFIQT